MGNTLQRKVTVIPAKASSVSTNNAPKQLRVAAYCRVSTDDEDQINSYEAQIRYYTQLINDTPGWSMAGVFADEGITGTNMKKRDNFKRMIAACKRGRIDLILVKSISRFARNTVDTLQTVRELKARNIGVIFEKENIDTLKESSEFLITIFSSFAQAESESMSKNILWGIQKSMAAGKANIDFNKVYGYTNAGKGQAVIVPEQAKVVRHIYKRYLEGMSYVQIRKELEASQYPAPDGGYNWSDATVRNILLNEKYIGDVLRQKTYTTDCLTKTVKKNNGEKPMYYIENNHPPIISRTMFRRVQDEHNRRISKRKVTHNATKTEKSKYSAKYALSERLICGECGSYYKRCTWTSNGQKRIVWRCISRLDNGKKYCHNSPTIYENKLQQAILAAENALISENEAINTLLELSGQLICGRTDGGLSIAQSQNRLAQLTEEQEQLLDMILEDMDNPQLNSRMKELTDEKQMLLDQIEQAKSDADQSQLERERLNLLGEWLNKQSAMLEDYDDILTRKLVEKITVVDSEKIAIKLYSLEETMVQDL